MKTSLVIFFPVLLGSFAVLQAIFNRKIGSQMGFSGAAIINASVLLCLASFVFGICIFFPNFVPKILLPKIAELKLRNFSWWYILPGIFGYSLVLFGPVMIEKVGALRLFIGILVGQVLTSIFIDVFFENIPISIYRILGSILAVTSAVLVTLK